MIGTSEHSMIGKFIDSILPEETLPRTLNKLLSMFPERKRMLMELKKEGYIEYTSLKNRK